MASYNKVLLMGNLTRDIELRAVGTGQNVARIGLAVNRHYTTQSGEKREETTFVDCEAWGKTAEIMAKYLAKGRPVFIEGRLKLDQWQDKESGQNRTKLAVVIESFQFVDSRAGGGPGGGGDMPPDGAGASNGGGQSGGWSKGAGAQPARTNPRPAAPASGGEPEIAADDIPF